ncbi:hypothetical protein V5O48_007270 [Marasmius crinis-equi]|uniref:DUF3835 domain-containing protein n=1 Tax=Marasmius crinis-equi TaxID=585013 RepID=A0ABR3FHB5_9AGAR
MANVQADAQGAGLQNLLQSIAPDAVDNVTPEALQRLTEKLSELMGEDVQGLPLVDVTDGDQPKSSKGEFSLIEEPPLVPLSSLSPTERAKHKKERDRILDLLEQEEEEQERKTAELERQERQVALEKRKEAARSELEKLKLVKETHKKMGKALMLSMAEARETQEVQVKEERESYEAQPKAASSSKKTVTFADVGPDTPSPSTSSNVPADWGDLSKGKLRTPSKPNLLGSQSELLMKKDVVERIPGQPTTPHPRDIDSDDESEPELEDEHSDADQDLEEDEFDLDYALHQREIALAYQEKRGKIGEEAAVALTSHTHDPDEDPSLEKAKTKTPVSKFRANRLASAFAASSPSQSQSIGASVVPAAGADTLQRAIRMGKVDEDGKLVGGEHESDDEDHSTMNEQENEAVQDVLDLLKKGQVYNMGPEGGLQTVPPEKATTAPFTKPTEPPLSARQREKAPSKFKLARGASPSVNRDSPASGSSTPISTIDRSSPKLLAVVERAAPSPSPLTESAPTVVASPSYPSASSMIIESPSFPSTGSSRPARPPVVMATAVKERETKNAGGDSHDKQEASTDTPPKRVSRFKAERM